MSLHDANDTDTMKKFLVFLSAIIMSLSAGAQVSYGLRYGLNSADMSGNGTLWDNISGASKTGFSVGPTIKIVPMDFVGVDISALYEQHDVEIAGIRMRQRAASFPVNLRLHVIQGQLLTLTAFAGPQFSFNISGENSRQLREEIGEWEWKQSNLSANLGVAAMLFNHFELGISYNLSMGKTGEFNGKVWDEAKANVKNRKFDHWRIGLAVYF